MPHQPAQAMLLIIGRHVTTACHGNVFCVLSYLCLRCSNACIQCKKRAHAADSNEMAANRAIGKMRGLVQLSCIGARSQKRQLVLYDDEPRVCYDARATLQERPCDVVKLGAPQDAEIVLQAPLVSLDIKLIPWQHSLSSICGSRHASLAHGFAGHIMATHVCEDLAFGLVRC